MNVDGSAAPRGLIRQGDVLLVPIAELPERVELVRRGRLVLAEGEATGHAHVIDDERATLHGHRWSDVRYVQVVGHEPVSLVHEEHDPLRLSPGVYEVRRQREYAPRVGFRRVSD